MQHHTPWPLADRTRGLQASMIREILKAADQPGMLSMAGGLPAPESFPVQALARASERLWRTQATQALQYAASEGLPALRQWLADRFCLQGWRVQPSQILITTGSQQGLDLLGKVLLDPGSPVLMEQPAFLGAMQAFASYQPRWQAWARDAQGPRPDQFQAGQRAAYLVPTFQNPLGHTVGLERRLALVAAAARQGVPIIEDDPYSEMWFDHAPPPPLAQLAPEQVIYLGSFSKVLSPGLRLGYVVCPRSQMATLGAKLLYAKQGADLHTPGFNQRLVMQLIDDGFVLDEHLGQVRQGYKAKRDAMHQALKQHLPPGFEWVKPEGGMFFWVQGPQGFDARAALAVAQQRGLVFVPGDAFHVDAPANDQTARQHAQRCMRLSFVTLSLPQIEEAVARLAASVRHAGTLEACH
jgi:2-aminoadipate transaminase